MVKQYHKDKPFCNMKFTIRGVLVFCFPIYIYILLPPFIIFFKSKLD
jgi:hypothetical protein